MGLSFSTQDLGCGAPALWSAWVQCPPGCSRACGILVRWPGIEPLFPAWQGGVLTTGLPQKFPFIIFKSFFWYLQMLLLLLGRFSRVRLCVTPQTAAHQAPLSLGFSRKEYWSGLPFPSPMHKSEK